MPLTKKECLQIKEELDNCKRPFFLFDDDPDGLSSFLILYRYKQEGRGMVIKSKPFVDDKFVQKVEEYQPDKVFILDMPMVEQSFIDAVKVPIIWIDHHEPVKRENIKYFNPRIKKSDEYYPTTALAYDIVKKDLWIAAVGCIADMHMPKFLSKFKKQYKGYVGKEKKTNDIYFNTKLGTLIRLFSFMLKGKTSEVNKCFKILTRIKEPDEILEQKSSAGNYLYKKYEHIEVEYRKLLERALTHVTEDALIVFIYEEDKMSFTGDIANYLIYKNPEKIVIVGREKQGEVRMSLRSAKINLREIVQKALTNVEGYGGGHELACGANVKKKDFDVFLKQIREQLN